MRQNVENMETEMAKLTSIVEKVAISSTTVHNALAEKRAKVHQLSGVHNLLKKVSKGLFLFSFVFLFFDYFSIFIYLNAVF